ncbi:hypothetical protein RO3G_06404 [Rhizopus delemar RA 99-880]|uniref:Uncharacterized protein n=1 Tax=Rhizopus delemar (strain RA 99-880 / ATCC MYA-4621 / FGSC 9543 / NRRL 43880) TaxID=246409 RepID=I1BZR9_RHIO9|nr:hypothetical protein RO3G_06404 [Rhizopus delemar RA 99-880]|eukprot:EIE81699.1 hypothetical protein RO3G_06404 [Rhizopus delemar RA 99-880]
MQEAPKHKHHRSMPSLSFSTSTSGENSNLSSPRTSYHLKRHSDSIRRWDDSQLELELAEDDLIKKPSSFLVRFPKLKRKLSRQQEIGTN